MSAPVATRKDHEPEFVERLHGLAATKNLGLQASLLPSFTEQGKALASGTSRRVR
jgi:hypothetical protein